jgi:peptide/nickel transport system permease protein
VTRFILRRLLQALPLLLLVSVVTFALIHAAPGGPLALYLSNPNVRPADIERLRHALGLDRPLWLQYVFWLAGFLRGDWGYSYADGRLVTERVLERLPATLELMAVSTLLAGLVAVPLGVVTAARRGSRLDRAATACALAGIALPVFWFGLLLQLGFALGLGWLPSSGRTSPGGGDIVDRLRHLVLPASVLMVVQAAAWSRYLRASMVQALSQPYVAAGWARGVSRGSLIFRHALKNALAPTVAVMMLDAAMMVSGAVVTESVFAWPGIGSLFTEALSRRDYTVLMALLMLSSMAVVVFNLLADMVARLVDPRVEA